MAYNQDERLWSACGEEEPYREPSCYQSNLGPKLGQFLNGREISFKHVKIVNCKPEKTEVNSCVHFFLFSYLYISTK